MHRFVSVPLRSARSFIIAKNTGTRIKTLMVEVTMPPTIGAAMGFMTSEPIPDSHRIGARRCFSIRTRLPVAGQFAIERS